jgi:hypothetical protein
MIGQVCVATLWSVSYSFEAPRSEQTQRFVTGDTLILTADPTGDDLRQVTERFVMGAKPAPGYSKFLITASRRIQDVTGLGQFIEPDRGWPSNLATSALILETLSAGASHKNEANELAKQLVFASAEIAALKAQLEAFDLVPVPLRERAS